MMSALKRSVPFVTMMTLMILTAACSSGGGSSSWGSYTSPNATASGFVQGLNDVDPQLFPDSYVVLDYYETERTYVPGEEDWFVIWDDKYGEYKAVSLQYLRSIVYYDYYRNNAALADEFRAIEDDDIDFGDYNGDYYGDDYEVVDYDPYTNLYYGRNSGFAYEDEEQTYDVALMQAEKEQKQFFQKASAISYQYEVSIETSMALITLGQKVKGMFAQSGEVTPEDQEALMGDIEHLTGVGLGEMAEAAVDSEKKDEIFDRIAEQIGTNADSLEHRILPDLFNVNL